jgi:NAD(P)-dependent dehydrogenase (short-subunit alcohol dehydrogenase family)
LKTALGSVQADLVGLRGIVANAGIGGANEYGPTDRWDEILATNLTGTYRLVHELLPFLRGADAPVGTKQIVMISSILGRIGVPGYTAYCASKAGLLGLMRSLAVGLAPEQIRVNAICPGWVDTEMSSDGLAGIAHAMGISVEEARRQEMSKVPLGKMSAPREIGEVVAFLLSGRERSITGQALDVNNGAFMN